MRLWLKGLNSYQRDEALHESWSEYLWRCPTPLADVATAGSWPASSFVTPVTGGVFRCRGPWHSGASKATIPLQANKHLAHWSGT